MEIRRCVISSDNGIYILQSNDGYRVIHAQAIDNLYWWQKSDGKNWECRDELNPEELINYFGKCKIIKTDEEALKEAKRLYIEVIDSYCGILEYGISYIKDWQNKEFPKK